MKCRMATAHLMERTLLKRVLEVTLDDSPTTRHIVTYSGRGIGSERVLVDGEVRSRHASYLWFVPRFSFRIGDRQALIEVRVWPWFGLRSFRLTVDDQVLYEEGG